MATFVRGAPLPELRTGGAAVTEDAHFQELALRSASLVQKILISIPDTHKSCIHTETFQLNSTENAKLTMMMESIGIPSAPVLNVVSDTVTAETSLRRMLEGLQLHRSLLSSIMPRLNGKDKVTELLADIRDLLIQIPKMLRTTQTEPVVLPSPASVTLSLPGEYEVQVAAHLTLVQLQAFARDMVRSLRSMEQSDEDETATP
ncbi:colony stimulating factor 3 (granulocyte) a isoform X2 [Genypterus blacodes]